MSRFKSQDANDERARADQPLGPADAPPALETLARLIHRGSELLRDGSAHEAIHVLERAAHLFPDNRTARHLLATAAFQIGDLERALALYEATLREDPGSTAAKVNVAVVCLKLGRAAEARTWLEEVVRAAPQSRRAWGYLGVAFEQLGLVGDAENAFIAGHFASAAKRLRERHPELSASAVVPDSSSTPRGVPAYPRRTLPAESWSGMQGASAGNLRHSVLPRLTATLRPPDLPPIEPLRPTGAAPAFDLADGEPEEIAFEQTVASLRERPPPAMSNAPKPNRPVVPLLDAALSSLLVVPHEAVVVAHPTGLVVAGLVQGDDEDEGGFAARSDVIHALAGPLRRRPLPRRPAPAPEPFRNDGVGFTRVSGTGQLILAPSRGTRLLPLEMNADVAFLREDVVVGFDHALLYDLGRMRHPSGTVLSLVRFRGDGVIVLALEAPFLAFDVRGEESITLRSRALVGWIGLLVPEPVPDDDTLLAFSGEGTVLFRAPHDA